MKPSSSRVGRCKNISWGCIVAFQLLARFKLYQIYLIIWFWGWVTQEWVWATGQSLRHVLSFPLSSTDIYLQTALSTGFHVIPLWTAKLTSLCIIEACITKKRMRGASLLWLWKEEEWGMKEAGRKTRGGEEKRGSFSPGPEDEMGEKKEGSTERGVGGCQKGWCLTHGGGEQRQPGSPNVESAAGSPHPAQLHTEPPKLPPLRLRCNEL